MPSFEHKKLIERIAQLDQVPEDAKAYASWTEAGEHLALLQENARANELALDPFTRHFTKRLGTAPELIEDEPVCFGLGL